MGPNCPTDVTAHSTCSNFIQGALVPIICSHHLLSLKDTDPLSTVMFPYRVMMVPQNNLTIRIT